MNSGSWRAEKYARSSSSTGSTRVSGTKRPPNSPKYPRRSGSRRDVTGAMHSLEQRSDSTMILAAGRALHARRDVDAERPHARDRVGDVVGREPAGQQH